MLNLISHRFDLYQMPIKFFTSDENTRVRQSFVSPTVYLDHWAIRLFSDDLALQDRLVASLLRHQGTLLLSTNSFAEFARNDDRRHALAAEEFFERLLPNIYLTDNAIDKLHEQELLEPNNARRFWPPADLPQLKLFAERAPDSPLGFTMGGFITMARDNHVILEAVTKEALHMIRSGLESLQGDPEYVRAARNSRPTSRRTRTYIIMGELMREFILNSNIKMGDNDVIDMLHAAIPVNCCDFVLLDSAWENRVKKMRQRLENIGEVMPIAKCYSPNGVLKFLDDLDTFKTEEPQK